MISIHSNQVTKDILSLFYLSKPTMPRAFNILEGVTRGHILVDDVTRPTWAVVHEGMFGTLYIGGQMDASTLEMLVQHFRQSGDVGIGCWLDEPLNVMLPSNPDYDDRTLYFTKRLPQLNAFLSLPEGYHLAVRDQALSKQSFDYQSTLDSFGTEENVLKHTLGVDILHEGKVVCEAATGASTHGRNEIGVTTAEPHRQRGLATIACAHLVEMCEVNGYKTWWDCAKQNTPSAKLARKLGFCHEQEYRYVWWMSRISESPNPS